MRSHKMSWHKLYKQFKTKFPRISKEAIYFRPYGFMAIEIWFENGNVAIYDGFENSLKRLDNTWK